MDFTTVYCDGGFLAIIPVNKDRGLFDSIDSAVKKALGDSFSFVINENHGMEEHHDVLYGSVLNTNTGIELFYGRYSTRA